MSITLNNKVSVSVLLLFSLFYFLLNCLVLICAPSLTKWSSLSFQNEINLLGPVVQKPINAKPGLKVNHSFYLAHWKCFCCLATQTRPAGTKATNPDIIWEQKIAKFFLHSDNTCSEMHLRIKQVSYITKFYFGKGIFYKKNQALAVLLRQKYCSRFVNEQKVLLSIANSTS